MDKMKLIPINITKACLTRISLTFKDKQNKVEVGATLSLQTENGTQVTDVSFATDAWAEDQKIKPSMDIIPIATNIRKSLEETCIAHVNRFNKMIGDNNVNIG
jgi:hypothetical protein